MRVFLDECCPPQLATALRALGHDVFHALEQSHGQTDARQAMLAFTDRRIVVTADYDFTDMAVRDGIAFVGLIILAPGLGNLREIAEWLAQRIAEVGDEAAGQLTIVDRDRIRSRRI